MYNDDLNYNEGAAQHISGADDGQSQNTREEAVQNPKEQEEQSPNREEAGKNLGYQGSSTFEWNNAGQYRGYRTETTETADSAEKQTEMEDDMRELLKKIAEESKTYRYIEASQLEKEVSRKKARPARAKQGSGIFKKLLLAACMGLFFGLFAGVTFYGVQYLTGDLFVSKDQEVVGEKVENSVARPAEGESQSGIKLVDSHEIRVVSADVTDVVDKVMPAMVSIVNRSVETSTSLFGQSYNREVASSGSGIIVAESETELLIVSNHHVVADANKLEVSFIDGTVAEALIKGMNSDMDLAVIAIPLESLSAETKAAIAIATMGDSETLKMGEPVVAIGNALGYGQSVTTGVISALNREITVESGMKNKFLQTDAAINPGNSGGALLNVKGEVIGINSNKIGGSTVEGMGYAIPISSAKPIIAELMLKETRTKLEESQIGYIGITMQTITASYSSMLKIPEGVYIVETQPDSPAEKAGLCIGDVIVKFEGEKIGTHEDLQSVLQYYKAGSTVTITVQRLQNGQYQAVDVPVTLGVRPANNQ